MGDRIHALDGMRAVAACLVVAHHLGIANFGAALSNGGHTALGHVVSGLTASGVELFFVLSPVVLAGPYVRGKRRLNTGKYGARRVERLLPPYLAAWLLAGLQIYLLTTFPTWWTERASLPSFSLSDWISQIGIIYIGNHSYNFAWWSLTIEVAFYVMLPAIIPLVRHANRRQTGVFIAFLGSIAVSSVYALPSVGNVPILSPMAIYASCFSRVYLMN
jgi:peptidoglycan/LPS O-acetylase OafA/YrhL